MRDISFNPLPRLQHYKQYESVNKSAFYEAITFYCSFKIPFYSHSYVDIFFILPDFYKSFHVGMEWTFYMTIWDGRSRHFFGSFLAYIFMEEPPHLFA